LSSLFIDCKNKTASYNGNELNIFPNMDDVKRDAMNIVEYFNGFKHSIGDMEDTLAKYWKTLIYMYLAPIIPQMRYAWSELGHEESRAFPVYLLIVGPSDSGKSHFIQMVQKSMLGKKLKKLHENCFTGSVEKEKKGHLTISALSSNAKGVPFFIDEMTMMYWKYADNIVKYDRIFDGEEEYQFRPCYVIVSNKIESNTKEVTKRVVRFDVANRFPEDYVLNNTDDERIIREMGTSFYMEYVRRVLEKIDDFIEDMQKKSDNSEEPDIFEFGALTLLETFADLGIDIPEGLTAFNKYDYIGGKNRCDKSLKMLKEEYAINPSIFTIDTKRNQIEIDFSTYDRKECERRIKILSNELPNILDCQNRGSRVTLKYRETEQETGIRFKKVRRFLWRK
jgi:hypothetical protein